MKRIILMALTAFMSVQLVNAQAEEGKKLTPAERAEKRVKMLDEKLNLSDAQEKMITTYYTDFMKQESDTLCRRSEKFDLHYKIVSILTDDQLRVYAQMDRRRPQGDKQPAQHKGDKNGHDKHFRGRHDNMQHAPMTPEERVAKRVERLNSKLNLTDAQKSKIEELCLANEKKEKGLKDELSKNIEKVFTTEQKSIYAELKKNRKN